MAGEEIVFTAGRLYRVDRQGSVRWSLFSEGSLRCIQNGDWVSSQLLEDCFQNDLGEHVILPGQILYDVKVIHTTQLLERGLPSHAEKCLVELLGLPVELWGVMLTHKHQHRAGWSHRLCWNHIQVSLWTVSLSI